MWTLKRGAIAFCGIHHVPHSTHHHRHPIPFTTCRPLSTSSASHSPPQSFTAAIASYRAFKRAHRKGSSRHSSSEAVQRREDLRLLLDHYIALPPTHPEKQYHRSHHRHQTTAATPVAASIAEGCSLALEEGWPRRSCELFFSSSVFASAASLLAGAENDGDAVNNSSRGGKEICELPLEPVSISMPPCVIHAAALLLVMNAAPSPSSDTTTSSIASTTCSTTKNRVKSAIAPLQRCVALVERLVTYPSTTTNSNSSSTKGDSCEEEEGRSSSSVLQRGRRARGEGAALAMALYFYPVWFLFRSRVDRHPRQGTTTATATATNAASADDEGQASGSEHPHQQQLRRTAERALEFLGIPLSGPPLTEEDDVIEVSLRRLLYCLADAGGAAAKRRDQEDLVESEEGMRVMKEGIAVIYSQLLTLLQRQEELSEGRHFTAGTTPTPAAADVHLFRGRVPSAVYQSVFRAALAVQHWDTCEQVTQRVEDWWWRRKRTITTPATSSSRSHLTQPSSQEDQRQLTAITTSFESDGSRVERHPQGQQQETQEEQQDTGDAEVDGLLLVIIRYFTLTRQTERALSWWLWEGADNKLNSSSRLLLAHSVPVLTALARVLSECPPRLLHRLPPAATSSLALQVMEALLDRPRHTATQSFSVSGEALFVSLIACAKVSPLHFPDVLRSLTNNQVLALNKEELLYVQLLHCRRCGGRPHCGAEEDGVEEVEAGLWVHLVKLIPSLPDLAVCVSPRTGTSLPDGSLSERCAFLLLLLLQEANEVHFVPVWCSLWSHFTGSHHSGSSSSSSLSMSSRTRWVMLALVFATANYRSVSSSSPEWVSALALLALQSLEWAEQCGKGGSSSRGRSSSTASLSSSLASPVAAVVQPTEVMSHELWWSLQSKWKAFHQQYPLEFWVSCLASWTAAANTSDTKAAIVSSSSSSALLATRRFDCAWYLPSRTVLQRYLRVVSSQPSGHSGAAHPPGTPCSHTTDTMNHGDGDVDDTLTSTRSAVSGGDACLFRFLKRRRQLLPIHHPTSHALLRSLRQPLSYSSSSSCNVGSSHVSTGSASTAQDLRREWQRRVCEHENGLLQSI